MGEADCQQGLRDYSQYSFQAMALCIWMWVYQTGHLGSNGIYGFLVSERFENSTMVFLLNCGDCWWWIVVAVF